MATLTIESGSSIQMDQPFPDFSVGTINFSDNSTYEIVSGINSNFLDMTGSFTYPNANLNNDQPANGGIINTIVETLPIRLTQTPTRASVGRHGGYGHPPARRSGFPPIAPRISEAISR
jgi:hypothetical protein